MISKEEFLEMAAACYDDIACHRLKVSHMTQLEGVAQQAGTSLGRLLLETHLANGCQTKSSPGMCPQCAGKLRIQNENQARTLKTTLGAVTYRRPYAVCDRCGFACAWLDLVMGIPARGPSVSVLQRICHAAVSGRSFEKGKETLRVHSGLEFSRKSVRSIAEKEGKKIADERAKQVELLKNGKLTLISKEQPTLIVVTCDGGRVQTRNFQTKDRWKEDKIGAVYDAIPRPHSEVSTKKYQGAKAGIKTFTATMKEWDELGWMLYMEATARGYQKALEKLFLADGAKPIRDLKNLHFSDATFILDWGHAAEHLSASAKAFFGEGTVKAQAWYQEQEQYLWDGNVATIIPELQKMSLQLGAPASGESDSSPRTILHRDAFSYFPNNSDALNYPAYRAKGWPIGSGIAESSVKQFGLRLKGSEKFWNISNTGAEEMLALCALYHSEDGRWGRYWDRRAQPLSIK